MAATASAAPADSTWRQKDATQWSNPEVRSFVESVLPGHACVTTFGHTSGRVLCTLSKEDLRKQVRDEEAVNVILSELRRVRKARQEKEDLAQHGAEPYTVFVRTPADVSVELEVLPTDTVSELKARLARVEGTPAEAQRLTRNGAILLDEKPLAAYNIAHGTVLLLVPRLSQASTQRYAPPPATRAPAPSGVPRPSVPVVCSDLARPFPMSLEFQGIPEYQSFMLALQRQSGRQRNPAASNEADEGAPFLEIVSNDNNREAVQTRITFDAEAEVLLIDSLGDILMERTRYRVLLHLREEEKYSTLVTGCRTADR